jgi:hypothetical protein
LPSLSLTDDHPVRATALPAPRRAPPVIAPAPLPPPLSARAPARPPRDPPRPSRAPALHALRSRVPLPLFPPLRLPLLRRRLLPLPRHRVRARPPDRRLRRPGRALLRRLRRPGLRPRFRPGRLPRAVVLTPPRGCRHLTLGMAPVLYCHIGLFYHSRLLFVFYFTDAASFGTTRNRTWYFHQDRFGFFISAMHVSCYFLILNSTRLY